MWHWRLEYWRSKLTSTKALLYVKMNRSSQLACLFYYRVIINNIALSITHNYLIIILRAISLILSVSLPVHCQSELTGWQYRSVWKNERGRNIRVKNTPGSPCCSLLFLTQTHFFLLCSMAHALWPPQSRTAYEGVDKIMLRSRGQQYCAVKASCSDETDDISTILKLTHARTHARTRGGFCFDFVLKYFHLLSKK